MAVAVTAGALASPPSQARRRPASGTPRPGVFTSLGLGAAFVFALVAVQIPSLRPIFGSRVNQLAADLGQARLNASDRAMLDRGYYEGLTTGGRFNAELWEFYMTRPQAAASDRHDVPGFRFRDDYLEREFAPNSIAVTAGKNYRINRWGMRDQDYTLEKPAGTYRIAMIGDSRAVGWGVEYEERFETLLEQQTNKEWTGGATKRYEILNFSMDGYVPVQRLLSFEEKGLRCNPDAVIYIAGRRDTYLDHHAQMVRRGVEIPYDFLEEIDRKAGLAQSMSEAEITRRMQPYRFEIASHVYHRFGELFRQHGIVGIWIFLPNVDNRATDETPENIAELKHQAEDAGFITIDLSSLFVEAGDSNALRLSRWDDHPNAKGHKLIADVIFRKLSELRKAGTFASPHHESRRAN
ncbi:MAG: SGNH/GDSL hydrolase family protein [Rhodospirillaceae bacterium]